MEQSRMMCSIGKKTPKSRLGVIHSCMVDIHSNVPCILAMPHSTHSAHNSGSGIRNVASRLHTTITAADVMSSSLLLKRNFMRKSTGK